MIATMTPAMMARYNGLLAMGRSRANRVPSEGIVSSDKELSRHPRAYGITAKNKNTAKMTKSVVIRAAPAAASMRPPRTKGVINKTAQANRGHVHALRNSDMSKRCWLIAVVG